MSRANSAGMMPQSIRPSRYDGPSPKRVNEHFGKYVFRTSTSLFSSSTRVQMPLSFRMQKKSKVFSPAMLPRAQTACSLMFSIGEASRAMKAGTAPCSTTCCVCQEVPDATLVRDQAASNCNMGSSFLPRNSTKRIRSPASTISFRGGFLSRESSFL